MGLVDGFWVLLGAFGRFLGLFVAFVGVEVEFAAIGAVASHARHLASSGQLVWVSVCGLLVCCYAN